ncbi:class I SAM-dependent methyltransferase [archaeon]|nr:class I SAM-dependent methyltransferase [archaeon]
MQKKRLLIDLGTGSSIHSAPRLMQLYTRELKKEEIRKKKSNWKLIGIDPHLAPSSLRNYRIISSDALHTLKKRQSNSADIINSDYFLESIYFINPKDRRMLPGWFKEIKRVLKPNGRLYLTVEKAFVERAIEGLRKAGLAGIASKKVVFPPEQPAGGTFSSTAKRILSEIKAGGKEGVGQFYDLKHSVPYRITARKQKGD